MSIVSDTRILLNESSSIFWPDQQIYDAINKAQIEVYAETELLWTSVVFTAYAGSEFIALPVDEIMIPKYILSTDGKEYLTTYADLERNTNTWRYTPEGKPQWWVLWDMFILRPYPRPDQDYTYDLWGIPWPVEVTENVLDVNLPAEVKKVIMYRAAAGLMEHTRTDLADAYQAISNEHLQRYKVTLRNYDRHNIRHLKPGNIISSQRRGSTLASRYV